MSAIPPLAKPSKTSRGKVANGTRLHTVDVDGRTAEARRFRDIFAEIVSDLGGAARLSEAQRQLARRATLMSVQCELLEAASITGQVIDLDTYGQLADRVGRAFTRLGIKRAARDVTPDLRDYIRSQTP